MAKLYTLKVRRSSNDSPLILHYSNRSKAERVAGDLWEAGFKVSGLYDPATRLNADSKEAVELANVFLGGQVFSDYELNG